MRTREKYTASLVVLTDHVADHTGRFAVGPVPRVTLLVHRMQDAPMHRLQAVADVRQSPAHDHAHGVIEIGLAHLVADRNGGDVGGRRRYAVLVVGLVCHGAVFEL